MSLQLDTLLNVNDVLETKSLSQLVRSLNLTGHNPATSGNYSLRSMTIDGTALVSESGVDKSLFSENNFILQYIKNGDFYSKLDHQRKSSDETQLHLAIYKTFNANCVLHSHILECLLFADLHPHQEFIELTGLELLKGLKGIKSHEEKVVIPVFDNTQDIATLAEVVQKKLTPLREPIFSFILRGHGIYVWGQNVKEAKRHLEVFEYLFKYYLARHRLQN